jgi:hypothetical protein
MPLANKLNYDPVPPYDLEDVEAHAGQGPSEPQTPNNQEPNVSSEPSDDSRNQVKLLSERERCAWGLAYFTIAMISVSCIVYLVHDKKH